MAKYLVIQLHPEKPVTAVAFENYLKGLTIEAYDLSVDSPTEGTPIGTANYIEGKTVETPDPPPMVNQLLKDGYPWLAPAWENGHVTDIIQNHYYELVGTPPIALSKVKVVTDSSLAIAVIKFDDKHEAADIRLIARRNENEIIHRQKYYNVISAKINPIEMIQHPVYKDRVLVKVNKPHDFEPDKFKLINIPTGGYPISLYFKLPAPPATNLEVSAILPDDGAAPSYNLLYSAVKNVLNVELNVIESKISELDTEINSSTISEEEKTKKRAEKERLEKIVRWEFTLPQCRHIAYEILWGKTGVGRPEPESSLKELYTEGDGKDDDGSKRQKFEGDLLSYYSQNNSLSDRLANYVYTLSAAKWCEEQSKKAEKAGFLFPVLLSEPDKCSKIILEGIEKITIDDANKTPAFLFLVPAEYFYALSYTLPPQIKPQQRYDMAIAATEAQNISIFKQAIEDGVITKLHSERNANIFQAASRLQALGLTKETDVAKCNISQEQNEIKSIGDLIKVWSNETEENINIFWGKANTSAHLELLLVAIAMKHIENFSRRIKSLLILDELISKFVDLNVIIHDLRKIDFYSADEEIKKKLKELLQSREDIVQHDKLDEYIQSIIDHQKDISIGVTNLSAKTNIFWQMIFEGDNKSLLPEFTKPGTTDERTQAFIRHLRRFFDVKQGETKYDYTPVEGTIPFFTVDDCMSEEKESCVKNVIGLTKYIEPKELPGEFQAAFQFSVAETLWARGIISKDVVQQFKSIEAFKKALAGSIAYNYADEIWKAADADSSRLIDWLRMIYDTEETSKIKEAFQKIGITSIEVFKESDKKEDFIKAINNGSISNEDTGEIWEKLKKAANSSGGNLISVNQNGSLVNCIPPAHLSPLGPVAYLHDLLKVAGSSSCSDPLPMEAGDRLNSLLENRRGALGKLLASKENLEVPLPMIDLVNESLEYMVANNASSGTMNDTAEQDEIWGHVLTKHDPETLLAALPEHSTPADAASKKAYDTLKNDFSSCLLPYSQALDVSRTYLEEMGTSRFAVMRHFRKKITEFVLAPENEPAEFQDHMWRYPVRIETAIEYLKITKEEHESLFQEEIKYAKNCVEEIPEEILFLHKLFGFQSQCDNNKKEWTQVIVNLSEFLKRTCLNYCDFLNLWKSKFIKFALRGSDTGFPECEPCCLNQYTIQLPDQKRPEDDLRKLAIFIRLWRKLQAIPNARYTFSELKSICDVLELFDADGNVNPDFIRQLIAFQMLRDDFWLLLTDGTKIEDNASGADHIHLLSLFISGSKKYIWAVQHLLNQIQQYAVHSLHCRCRKPEFIKLLKENLGTIAELAGFASYSSPYSWHAKPTHTLRFAEILAKIYASGFSIGELLFLFTTQEHLQGDDPFPLQTANEAKDSPFGLPDDQDKNSLWALRQKLLAAEVTESAGQRTWAQMESVLRQDFGLSEPKPSGLPENDTTNIKHWNSLGQHFFPALLAASSDQRRYQTSWSGTVKLMWNTPLDGPFQYDEKKKELWTQIPLTDEAVLAKLGRIRQLSPEEQKVVRDLYFQPRAELARFAFLFSSLDEAEAKLIQEPDEAKRWAWFQQQFDLFYCRCQIIAEHLAAHVADVAGVANPEGAEQAKLLLKHLWADENFSEDSWESNEKDNKEKIKPPVVTWRGQPNGGAFAALLGLTGTGMLAEYTSADNSLRWRDICSSSELFGAEENAWNAPVPTIIPALEFSLPENLNRYAAVRNGFAMSNSDGTMLGGAEPFTLCWKGLLLIETDGQYGFSAGAPSPAGAMPEFQKIYESHSWRVTLKRGHKEWVLLDHDWSDEKAPAACAMPVILKKGFYNLEINLQRKDMDFDGPEDVCPQTTGFQLKYNGPDTGMAWLKISRDKLFLEKKEKDSPLEKINGIEAESSVHKSLRAQYVSTVRDMRRTYQRAFKAALFVCRLDLSAKQISDDGQSELGYLLTHPVNFAGQSYYYYDIQEKWQVHNAKLDFNFLPVQDRYFEPTGEADKRTNPSPQRQQAMFDWWERLFDYTVMRRETERSPEQPAWLLFHESAERHPDNPADLLRHLGVDLLHDSLVLQYNENYSVSSANLEDDRWAVRCWQAEKWVRGLRQHFFPKDITKALPDLWASNDPAAGTPSGNANLTEFYRNGCIENGEPRRYEDIKRLNDSLRLRGRDALVAYLTHMNRVSLPWNEIAISVSQLSELLLQDVQTGLCQKASRIEEVISAIQLFVQRARLGLEPTFTPESKLIQAWDRHFATFRIWEACKRRELYKENWIEFEQLQEDRQSESFQLLESELRRSTLTMTAVPNLPHPSIPLLSQREAARKEVPKKEKTEETVEHHELNGVTSLITPDRHARLGWLAPDDKKEKLPMWMQAAVRQGIQFVRVAAAGLPPVFAVKCDGGGDTAESVCCQLCDKVYPPVMDEYYFWIEESNYYSAKEYEREDAKDGAVEQVAEWGETQDSPQSDWHKAEKLPKLLSWNSKPMVHLHWCRVHNGEFQQPRQSYAGIRVKGEKDKSQVLKFLKPELFFLGRCVDSLFFEVKNGEAPNGFPLTTSEGKTNENLPGFRYDILADEAVVLPDVVPLQKPSLATEVKVNETALFAFPFFAWFTPGKPLLPPSTFSPAITVAGHLRTHCQFEPALKWYEQFYNPLAHDNSWLTDQKSTEPAVEGERPTITACCGAISISEEKAKKRAVLLHYLETMLQWGDALMRKNTPVAFQQARLIFETAEKILGAAPNAVMVNETQSDFVGRFRPECAPINPRLMCLYTSVNDRLTLIHNCLNAKRLRNGRANLDMPYFGNSSLRDCWKNSADICADEDEWCLPQSPYRFMVLLQKAQELTGDARALGGALLSAYEKGDGEYLSTMRTMHERQLLNLALEVRQYQWREADWQVQGLRKTKEIAQTRLRYYKELIAAGLIGKERAYQNEIMISLAAHAAGQISEAISQGMSSGPDMWLGTVGPFPTSLNQIPVGNKLGDGNFATAARISNSIATASSTLASLHLTEAGWDRREQEWKHQVDVLTIEIEQIERQILAAERRRDIALRELNNHQQQMENAAEVHDFLRDKFTSHALYLWMQQETAAMYYQMYELALHCARQAQRAFNFERGYTAKKFIPAELWDNLREGLLSGERLQSALRHMEKAYYDENVREYELAKHISLRLHFPEAFLQLRTTGSCEIELPEWLFDLDYPGHYMRRIKSVTLTVPCVAGPYTGIHCRLTLLSSKTRVAPTLVEPLHSCCQEAATENGYQILPDDPRIVSMYTATDAIATSGGQNDSGMFELNFRDERYLPFEFSGAVSRWRIELPPENNRFDIESLSDFVLHLNYTAREGGDVLRAAAQKNLLSMLPDNGIRLLDVRRDLGWIPKNPSCRGSNNEMQVGLRISRMMFPYLAGNHRIAVNSFEILVEAPDAKPGKNIPLTFFALQGIDELKSSRCRKNIHSINCVCDSDWPGFYHGVFNKMPFREINTDGWIDLGVMQLPKKEYLRNMYLLISYSVVRDDAEEKRITLCCGN